MHCLPMTKGFKTNSQPLLKAIAPNPSAKYRLICFPCAGGNASMFSSWPEQVPQDFEVFALNAPGRGARFFESPYTSMEELVKNLLEDSHLLAEKPYAIFGHSLGARVGYEFIRRATARGLPMPLHFVASGSRAPNIPCFSSPTYTLSSDAFMQIIYDMDGIPDELRENKEMMALLEPTFRADFQIAETYIGQVNKLACPITALCGTEDCRVPATTVEQWQAFTMYPITVKSYTGGHFFINHNDAALRDICMLLTKILAQSSGMGYREVS
ncbi:thioesterase II family protein [Shewanella waksmanii]|uniref:thioesterase II family protein n=1 Tax=Shewanella waksmanii TaxID=213783 RepID=UPI003735F400